MPYRERSRQHEAVERHRAKKQAVIIAFKAARGCAKCREIDTVVLELDHLDPTTKNLKLRRRNSKGWWHLGWNELYEELTKVQVLCANCHRRKTLTGIV